MDITDYLSQICEKQQYRDVVKLQNATSPTAIKGVPFCKMGRPNSYYEV